MITNIEWWWEFHGKDIHEKLKKAQVHELFLYDYRATEKDCWLLQARIIKSSEDGDATLISFNTPTPPTEEEIQLLVNMACVKYGYDFVLTATRADRGQLNQGG